MIRAKTGQVSILQCTSKAFPTHKKAHFYRPRLFWEKGFLFISSFTVSMGYLRASELTELVFTRMT